MNKQPGSTIVTTINGSRSCYITTERFAFFSVETKLTGTLHISNDILTRFWILFKNLNPLTKRQEKGICLIFKRNIPHPAHRCALRALIIASAERLKNLFVQAKFTQTLCIWTIHVPNENNSAIVIPTTRGECTTHCNCSHKRHTCKQKKSSPEEMFDFELTQVHNFCKNELITVLFKLFDGKDTSLVFFSNRNDNRICLFKCSTVPL